MLGDQSNLHTALQFIPPYGGDTIQRIGLGFDSLQDWYSANRVCMNDIWCNFIAIGIIHTDSGAGESREERSLDLLPGSYSPRGSAARDLGG